MAKGHRYFFLEFSEAKMNTPAIVASKVDTGGWMPVKRERVMFTDRISEKVQKKNQPKAEKVFQDILVTFHS
jgi:hypothetical protein